MSPLDHYSSKHDGKGNAAQYRFSTAGLESRKSQGYHMRSFIFTFPGRHGNSMPQTHLC